MCSIVQSTAAVWRLAARQHGVITRAQLLELGFTRTWIQHRIARARLHTVWRGVYAVGRPELSANGRRMAAVLACGPSAVLSHENAAALWGVRREPRGRIDVSVPLAVNRSRAGVCVHRRSGLGPADVAVRQGIPVTAIAMTLVDLATRLTRAQLERAVNEADKHDLIDPEALRAALVDPVQRPGTAALRETLDWTTFTLTDSELERRFLPLARRAGLPTPRTQAVVNRFRVDFYWPSLGLVVETDGLRYHRTPAQQAKDRRRDQTHAAAGLTPLRFTHAQIVYDSGRVEAVLASVVKRLLGKPRPRARGPAPSRP